MTERPMTAMMKDSQEGQEGFLRRQKWIRPLSAGLIAVGTLSRLAPLTEPHGRLLRQFMTEDGYLMQTVARNLALGHGLSVSDGTIATNGVQPLATFLFSFFYYLSGGDKSGGIAGVMVFSALVSFAAAAFLYALVRKLLKKHPDGQALAMLVAGLWFASPTIVKHSMNGLETGLYFLVTLATLNLFATFIEDNPDRFGLKQRIALGAMFGLCFLVRNDAAFLIAAVLLARMLLSWPRSARHWWDRIVEATIPGLISVVIASPWLIYNYRLFGSIVPISGIAEALGAQLGGNLIHVPAPLFDFVTLVLPIPLSARTAMLTILLSIAVIGMALVLAGKMLWSYSRSAPFILVTYGILGIFLILFYGGYFCAPYFMSRYLAVLSPVLALVGVTAAYRVLILIRSGLRQMVLAPVAALVVILVVGHNGRLYKNGMQHEHFQVVGWVEAHVPPQTWVGAPQTGTLGFFHDRTINLDGKVNPDALRAQLNEGGVTPYVLRSNISFLADWAGIAKWSQIEKNSFNQKFELIVLDTAANLAVFKRVGS